MDHLGLPEGMESALDGIESGRLHWLLLTRDGQMLCGAPDIVAPEVGPVYPGSFHPLHSAHRAVYSRVVELRGSCCYEVAIVNFSKGVHPRPRILQVLAQFPFYAPVLVTAQATFAGKVLALGGSREFVCGADVFSKVADHPEKPNSRFLVVNRALDGFDTNPNETAWQPLAERFAARPPGVTWQELVMDRMDVSSTKVRHAGRLGAPKAEMQD